MPRTDRQPRVRLSAEVRRERILAAAASAFAVAPYPEVSVAAIAAEAGASEALVHRYFDGKPGLYAAVVELAVDSLERRQEEAFAALPPNTSARDQVRVSLEVYLDYIADWAPGWAAPFVLAGSDPPAALEVRRNARAAYVDRLDRILPPGRGVRRRHAIVGYFGFLDSACLAWVEAGCPAAERAPLIEAALGALEGALGDWGG